jgi:hypothetical protein
MERYNDENQADARLLCSHLRLMTKRLRTLSVEQWDQLLTPTAPTVRQLATHIYQWLVCDRQHIERADARHHPLVPDAPAETELLCLVIEEEVERWEQLFSTLTPSRMLETRAQFDDPGYVFNVRGLVVHTLRSTLYKHGQMMTLFYAMGLDGDEAYAAPLPNEYYAEIKAQGDISGSAGNAIQAN